MLPPIKGRREKTEQGGFLLLHMCRGNQMTKWNYEACAVGAKMTTVTKRGRPWLGSSIVRASSKHAKVESSILSQGTYKNQPMARVGWLS